MITCRSAAEIERMRKANRLVSDALTVLEASVAPGVSTADLDRMAERLVRDAGAEPAFKGYRGFPATLCISINEEIIHGIPSPSRFLRDGDIVSIDLGAKLDGFYGDSAVTVPVGKIPAKTAELLAVTREALEKAIAQVRVGGRLSDLGHAVQTCAEGRGFSVIREFVGHGIGERLHEEPQIPNYGLPGRGPKLAEGMVLAIEPMIAMGRPETRVLSDGWTAVTRDGSVSAHFEHTVAVTAAGPLVLTARSGKPAGRAPVGLTDAAR
jgi:methionyl aminopeptidase